MELLTCTQCGAEIDGEGIRHRRRLFCSDECCEAFEDGFLAHRGPDAEDLAEEAEDDDLFGEEDLLEDDDVDDDVDDDLEDDAGF